VLACVHGRGFGRFFDYHVLEQIKTGKLIRVLEKFESDSIPASIVYPSSRHQSPNVRSFVSYAMPRLRQRLIQLQRLRNS
jgi:DNA-binding transcriptional LysR family regulator